MKKRGRPRKDAQKHPKARALEQLRLLGVVQDRLSTVLEDDGVEGHYDPEHTAAVLSLTSAMEKAINTWRKLVESEAATAEGMTDDARAEIAIDFLASGRVTAERKREALERIGATMGAGPRLVTGKGG